MAGYLPRNRGNRSARRIGPTVSRRLRTAGINVSPAARRHTEEGVFVSAQELYVSVIIDLGFPGKVRRAAQEVARIVTSWGIEPEVSEVAHESGLTAWVHFTYPDPDAGQEMPGPDVLGTEGHGGSPDPD